MKLQGEAYMTPKRIRLLIVAFISLFLLWPTASSVLMQDVRKKPPIRKEGLIRALKELRKRDSQTQVVEQIRQRGVDFELTPAIKRELLAAGARSELIEAVRANYRLPTPRPTPLTTLLSTLTPAPSSPTPTPMSAAEGQRILEREKTIRSIHEQLVLVPAGSFIMGGHYIENEMPAHEVKIRQNFYIGRYEVSQAQWEAVMGGNPSKFKGCDQCPVEQVSWDDAQEFIRRMNAREDGFTYRLPTESEWEYACRAGKPTLFAFGDSLSTEQANFDGNYPSGGALKGIYRNKTVPVDSFQPNAWGVYNMHGNVEEWVEDWYHENYNGDPPLDGCPWLSDGERKQRVVRGGAWFGLSYYMSSAYRNRQSPAFRGMTTGFRLAALRRGSGRICWR